MPLKVKFAVEKMRNKQKKIWRNKDRLYKYEEKDDVKVMEDPPQKTLPKEPRSPTPPLRTRGPFKPLVLSDTDFSAALVLLDELERQPEPEIKWWNNKIIRDEYDLDDSDSWFD